MVEGRAWSKLSCLRVPRTLGLIHRLALKQNSWTGLYEGTGAPWAGQEREKGRADAMEGVNVLVRVGNFGEDPPTGSRGGLWEDWPISRIGQPLSYENHSKQLQHPGSKVYERCKKRKIIFDQLFSSSCLSCPKLTILSSHNLCWWYLLRSVPAKVFLQKALRKVDFEQNFSSTAQGAPIPASNIGIVFYLSVIFNWEKLFAFWMFESSVILKWERLIALRLTPVFIWSVKN